MVITSVGVSSKHVNQLRSALREPRSNAKSATPRRTSYPGSRTSYPGKSCYATLAIQVAALAIQVAALAIQVYHVISLPAPPFKGGSTSLSSEAWCSSLATHLNTRYQDYLCAGISAGFCVGFTRSQPLLSAEVVQ